MPDANKLLVKVVASVQNVRFQDAMKLAEFFGFELSRTKAYQVRQLLKMVEEYNLTLRGES